MRYSSSFRWAKFALLALLGTLLTGLALILIFFWVWGLDAFPWAFLPAYAPWAIWYLRRTARDRVEFEAEQRASKAP